MKKMRYMWLAVLIGLLASLLTLTVALASTVASWTNTKRPVSETGLSVPGKEGSQYLLPKKLKGRYVVVRKVLMIANDHIAIYYVLADTKNPDKQYPVTIVGNLEMAPGYAAAQTVDFVVLLDLVVGYANGKKVFEAKRQ